MAGDERWETVVVGRGSAETIGGRTAESAVVRVEISPPWIPDRARLHIGWDDRAVGYDQLLLDDGTWTPAERGILLAPEIRARLGIEVPVAVAAALNAVRTPEIQTLKWLVKDLQADVERWRKLAETALETVDALRLRFDSTPIVAVVDHTTTGPEPEPEGGDR